MCGTNAKFIKYHKENPQIWNQFEKFANELVDAGVDVLSVNRIYERIRWESDVSGNDRYKLNNNFRPYYARLYEKKHPNAPKFKKRTSKADSLF